MPLVPPRPLLLALCLLVSSDLFLIPATTTMTNLTLINPWLSPCDLATLDQLLQPAAANSCPVENAPQPASPKPDCTKPDGSPFRKPCQCLFYFDKHKHMKPLCGVGKNEWAVSYLRQLNFAYCREFLVYDTLSDALITKIAKGDQECRQVIDSLVAIDDLAQRVSCLFSNVISRFDCETPFSTKFDCTHCQEAYRKWACSALLPHYTNFGNASNERRKIRPCRSICQMVAQQCPYFLPADHAPGYPTQYAGEPTFLCNDPNIPETGDQLLRSLYAEEGACCVSFSKKSSCEMAVHYGPNGQCEHLPSYEEALRSRQQTDDQQSCIDLDAILSATPRSPCTAKPMYSSPHFMPSSSARASAAAWLSLLLLSLSASSLPIRLLLPIICGMLLRLRLLVELLLALLYAPRARPRPRSTCLLSLPLLRFVDYHQSPWQYLQQLILLVIPMRLLLRRFHRANRELLFHDATSSSITRQQRFMINKVLLTFSCRFVHDCARSQLRTQLLEMLVRTAGVMVIARLLGVSQCFINNR